MRIVRCGGDSIPALAACFNEPVTLRPCRLSSILSKTKNNERLTAMIESERPK